MNIDSILSIARTNLRDLVGTDTEKKWLDSELIDDYANDAEDKLCEKCHLLEDYDTVGENLTTGTVTLTGSAGQIGSVSVNGITITSGAVSYNTSLTVTATNLASNITAYTSAPNYTATSSGAVVTISAVSGTGSNPNDYVVSATVSGGMGATTTNMTGGYALTKIYLLANKASYDLHPKTLKIVRGKLSGQIIPLDIYSSKKQLDMEWVSWEEMTGTPRGLIQNIKMKKVQFVGIPDTTYTCTLGVIRYPLIKMSAIRLDDTPEIAEEYHKYLFNWIYHRAFMKNDADANDPAMASIFLQKFLDDVEAININEIRRENYDMVCKPASAWT